MKRSRFHRWWGLGGWPSRPCSAKPRPDYRAFARRTDNLPGLIAAHFEEEEEVLLPLIDRSLTTEQFEKEIGGAAAHP